MATIQAPAVVCTTACWMRDEAAARSFEAKVNEALAMGATLLHGNVRRGALYSPTLVDHANAHLDAPESGEWTAAHTLKNVVLALLHLDGPLRQVPEGERDAELDRMLLLLERGLTDPA